jgi:thiol-disulfide isomerase/thioredoxin
MAQPKKPTVVIVAFAAVAALFLMAWVVSMRVAKIQTASPGVALKPLPTPVAPEPSGNPNASDLPVLAEKMPEFAGIVAWLDSPALSPTALKGKVVLVDFWTYSCINCIRTLPYVTAWYDKYKDQGLVVVGVHTPEFAFEKEKANVEDAIKRHGIHYPVAMDNDYSTWDAYGNEYWPAEYLFDAQGRLRHTHFGEGEYDQTEADIRSLLAEAGSSVTEPTTEVKTTTDLSKIGSPETYLGYARQEYFASPERVRRDAAADYSVPSEPKLNTFSLSGNWNIGSERATLAKPTGGIVYRFNATNANLVMGGGGKTVRALITLDGSPVAPAMRGADVVERDGKTWVDVSDERLYSLIDGKGAYGQHVLRIDFLDAGVQCYAFTFG